MADPIQKQLPMLNLPPRRAAIQSPPAPAVAKNIERLKQACEDFESIFVDFMLQQMRQTVPPNDLFGGGHAEQLYTSMMDSELAKSISRQRGLGLADQMYRQLIDKVAGKEIKDPEKT
jgi:flagellar protein FlgJ